MLDSSWSRQADFVAVWVYCLLRASYTPCDTVSRGGQAIHLEPGDFVTSREQISIQTGVQESKVERILKVFKSEQQIEQQNRGKFRIISILNWHIYQAREQQVEQQMNNKRTTDEQQMNSKRTANEHIQEGKEREEGKKGKEEVKDLSPAGAEVGDGSDFILTRKKRKLTGKRLETFLTFWDAFAYKSGKAEAADSWSDIPSLTMELVAKITEAAKREAARRPGLVAAGKTPKMAQGWLTARRWEDDQTEFKAVKRGLTDDFEETFCRTA